jgi:hypothetical protein
MRSFTLDVQWICDGLLLKPGPSQPMSYTSRTAHEVASFPSRPLWELPTPALFLRMSKFLSYLHLEWNV